MVILPVPGTKYTLATDVYKRQHKFEYDLNAILSDLIYTRVLEPSSKSSSFRAAKQFLERPTYELHYVYRALSVLASEMDFIPVSYTHLDVYKRQADSCSKEASNSTFACADISGISTSCENG